MTDTALATIPRPEALLAASVDHFAALVRLKSAIMKKGVDYGPIPGCSGKDSLFKPGAEKTLKNFMVHTSPEDTTIEDLSANGEIRYRITIGGRTPDGVVRGFGIGECSTAEDNYAWRKSVSQAEYDATSDDCRRVKYFANYTAPQVRVNPSDQANTVLKMAKKRAMVDLALTSCAASEFFTQDVEDLPPELRGEVIDVPQSEPEPMAPTPQPRAAAPAPTATDRPPDEWPPAKRVLWYMNHLGLSPEAVNAAAAVCRAPESSADWSDSDAQSIITVLHSPPPAAAPAAAPTTSSRRKRCTVCKELSHGVEDGTCPSCRALLPTRAPEPDPPPAPTGRPCVACFKHTPRDLLKDKLCPTCQAPEVAPGASPLDTQFASGKPDVTCGRCKAGPFWPAQMTFVGEHGLVCGQCVVVLGMQGKEPTAFACTGGCGKTVEVEGGKCHDCSLPAKYRAPARPAGPDDPKEPHELVVDAIRTGVADERYTQEEAIEALQADEELAVGVAKGWNATLAAGAVVLLEGLDHREGS